MLFVTLAVGNVVAKEAIADNGEVLDLLEVGLFWCGYFLAEADAVDLLAVLLVAIFKNFTEDPIVIV